MAFSINVGSVVRGVLMVVIGVIITFTVLADTATDVGNAAGNISAASGTYPLTSFFDRGGVLLLAMMAGIVLVFINILLGGKK